MDTVSPIEFDSKTIFKTDHILPPLPTIVSKIQEIIHNDDVDINEVTKLISSDPAMVAQILKLVNWRLSFIKNYYYITL